MARARTSIQVFAEFVARFRSDADKSGKREAARALGCSYQLVDHIINGRRAVSRQVAERAAELSKGEITRSELMFGDDAEAA